MYPEKVVYSGTVIAKSAAPATAANLAATAAQWAGYAVCQPLQVLRLYFFCTTTVTAGLIAPKVSVVRRPTYGSSSGAVTIGSMTIPTATAAGKVVYKDIAYASTAIPQAGEELSLEVAVQATDSGTAAGVGFISISYDPVIDNAADQTNMVAGV